MRFDFDTNSVIGLLVIALQLWSAYDRAVLKAALADIKVWSLTTFVTREEYNAMGPLRQIASKLDASSRV